MDTDERAEMLLLLPVESLLVRCCFPSRPALLRLYKVVGVGEEAN